MEELKKAIADLGHAFEEFKAENDERIAEVEKKGSADPLLNEKIDRINEDISRLSNMKAQLEQLETVVARSGLPGGDDGDENRELAKAKKAYSKAFKAWMRNGMGESGLKEMGAQASLSTQSDPDGGFVVPEEMEATIDRVAATVSAMRGIASVMPISTNTYKKLVAQGGMGSGWIGEGGTVSATATPTLAQITINTKKVYAYPAATQESLDDGAIDLESWLADEASILFAEEEGDGFINGNGVEEPFGFLSNTCVANSSYVWGKLGYTASGEAAAFTDVDKLIDTQHTLKAPYRVNSAWLMADVTQSHIRQFKDGNGNYIWVPGLQPGAPNVLLGKPVVIDDNMPTIAAGTYPIAYGNWARGYLIIERQGINILRNPYTSPGNVYFFMTRRVGGGVVNYEAIKLLKVAAS